MLLPRSPGSVGGVVRLFVVSFGLLKRELSPSANCLLARAVFWHVQIKQVAWDVLMVCLVRLGDFGLCEFGRGA
jgi:hypothetical protein